MLKGIDYFDVDGWIQINCDAEIADLWLYVSDAWIGVLGSNLVKDISLAQDQSTCALMIE